MPDIEDDIKLTAKERWELVIQASFQLIPYGIGASLASLYFGAKQEKRFKRIESFYQKLENYFINLGLTETDQIKDNLESLNEENKGYLVAILEEINEKVEREHIEEKIIYFRNYFINTLVKSIKNDIFDERRFFLNTLGSMTSLECELLSYLYRYEQNQRVKVGNIIKNGVDQYAIVGAITRLKSFGFIRSFQSTVLGETDYAFKENVQISPFGRKFCEFCIESQ